LVFVFRPIRTLISIVFIAAFVWCSFEIPLGGRTFADHMDRIGQTPEARDLVDGTRSTVNPALQEATHRLLGEHIVAPTTVQNEDDIAAPAPPMGDPTHASTAEHMKLPGRP
jgi:hypothetical protein